MKRDPGHAEFMAIVGAIGAAFTVLQLFNGLSSGRRIEGGRRRVISSANYNPVVDWNGVTIEQPSGSVDNG